MARPPAARRTDAVELEKRLSSQAPAWPRGRLLVGVSGGSDSLALLALLTRVIPASSHRLAAVHVHHGLRGPAADADQALVLRTCRRLQVPCVLYRVQVAHRAAARRESVETAGRLWRQECFLDAARAMRASAVLTAHHLEDQAETVLLNLLRGAGAQGLAAMPADRPFPHPAAPPGLRLIRPLLEVSKAELKRYLRVRGFSWREDASNRSPAFARNRVRHGLLPWLRRHIDPRAAERLARSARLLGADQAWLEQRIRPYTRWVRFTPHGASCPQDRLVRLDEARGLRLLAWTWERLGIPRKNFRDLEHIWSLRGRTRAQLDLPGQWRWEITSGALVWRRPSPGPARDPGTNPGPVIGVQTEILPRVPRGSGLKPDPDTIVVDADRLGGPLSVRTRRPKDVLEPLGMGGRRKPLKRVLAEMKIPLTARASWPILCVGRRVLWIFRGPLADWARVTSGTRRAMKITLFQEKNPGAQRHALKDKVVSARRPVLG